MFSLMKKHRDMMWLMNSVMISQLGTWFTYMLMVVAVYNATKDTLSTMAIVGAEAIAGLIGGQIAGVYIENKTPKNVLISTDSISAVILIGVFFLPFNLWYYSAAAFAIAFVSAFRAPTFQKYLVASVEGEALMSANGSFQMIRELVKIIGPALAVSVLALLPKDMKTVGFLIDACSYIFAAALLLRLKSVNRPFESTPEKSSDTKASMPRETWYVRWKAGLSPLKDALVLNVMVVLLFLLFGLAGADVILTAHLSESGYSSYGVGYVIGALGLGILITSAIGAKYVKKWPLWIQLGASSMFLGICYAFIGFSSSLIGMMIAGFATGIFNAIYNMSSITFWQQHIPYEKLGRFFGIFGSIASAFTLLGMALNGLISHVISAGNNIILCGILIALAGTVLMVNLLILNRNKVAAKKESA